MYFEAAYKAIDSMDNPLAVIKSKENSTSNWIVITDVDLKDNKTGVIGKAVVPIYLETREKNSNLRIDTNKINIQEK